VSVKIKLIVLSLLILLLSGCASTPKEAKAVQVIDGDTIVIEGGYHVRYIGIDTPEKDEPYYEEAKQYNQGLVDGKVVRLEKDEEGEGKDKYGRLLRYVYVDDIFVNAELVRKGYARVYPKGLFPEMEHYDLLKEAEEEAKGAGRGMWGSSDYYSSSSVAYMGLKAFTLTLATLPLRSKQV